MSNISQTKTDASGRESRTHSIEVYHDWNEFKNSEHPKVKPLAKKYGMQHNGSGMWLGSGKYGNGYSTTNQAAARDFEKAVHAVGLTTEAQSRNDD